MHRCCEAIEIEVIEIHAKNTLGLYVYFVVRILLVLNYILHFVFQ